MTISSSLRAKSACGFLILIWGYAAWPTIKTMLHAYHASGYEFQGYFALPLLYIFLMQQRGNFKRIKLTRNIWGLLLLICCATLWLFGTLTTLELVSQAALLGMIPSLILATCGRKITTTLAYPLIALLLLLPFGKPLFNLLQHCYSQLIVYSLALSKIAIYWENNNILIAKQQYSLDTLCIALKYSSLYLSLGFFLVGLLIRNWLLRLIMIASFVAFPFLVLYLSSYALMLFSIWREYNSFAAKTLIIISCSSVAIGLLAACSLTYILKTTQRNTYKNDGIDWHNEYAVYRNRWPATIVATVIIMALPSTAHYLQNKQHFASNWHNPASILDPQDVTLNISYNHQSAKLSSNDNNTWQQIKRNNLKIAVNGKKIPVTETISINKYHGKITWSMNYTNGHLTNNKTYSKILENMYALTKHGAKTAEITLVSDLGKNLQTSRDALKVALGELQSDACTTWLKG